MNEEQSFVILTTVGAVVLVGLALMLIIWIRRRSRRSRIEPIDEQTHPTERPPLIPSSPYLESLDSDDTAIRLSLTQPDNLIGRAAHADICIAERFPDWETVSREHARIHLEEGRAVIQDCNSMNGIRVNGRRTGRNVLRDGWRLDIGAVSFVYRQPGPAGEPPETHAEAQVAAVSPGTPSSAKTGTTVRLEDLSKFAPLPEGALLYDDRYEITGIDQERAEIQSYRVRDNSQPCRQCPNPDCGFLKNNLCETRCLECGYELSQAQLTYPIYSLQETRNPADFLTVSKLLERRVNHPALLLPIDYFEQTPYAESKRAYLVETEASSRPAASFAVPQELPSVLDWGKQLADGLGFLHSMDFNLGAFDLNWIVIEENGRVAKWTNLDKAKFNSPGDLGVARLRCSEDVRVLAELLLYLATGLAGHAPATALTLPRSIRNMFSRAMASQPQSFASAEDFGLALGAALAQYRSPTDIGLSVGQRSDVGRQRRLNEDGMLVIVVDQVTKSKSQPLGLFVIADGMGGHAAGDIAAQLTIDTIREVAVGDLMTPTSRSLAYDEWIGDAFSAANRAVYDRRRQSDTDMGNTLVLAIVAGDIAFIGNVGDSRAYLISQAGIRQITTDHSLVARLVAYGTISREEARSHPQRNVIYRTIGDQPQAEFDLFTLQLQSGDYILLCSDGLSGMITDQEIFDIVTKAASPQQACDQLIQAANDAGGTDNITIVAAQVEKGE